jgi:3-dehydroquinate synthase
VKIESSIRDYNVTFGDNFIESLLSKWSPGDFIIVDENVYKNYDELRYSGGLLGFDCVIRVNASEDTKSFAYIPQILDVLIGKFNRGNKIIAVGGGVVQDISAFISSILFRGVDWIFFPTTLLSQGDSCIGGKTSINYKEYKNQLGNFNPPNEVIICTEQLDTLSQIDISSGLGEMLHFFLVAGYDEYLFFIENISNMELLIKKSLEIKKGFIEKDEFDKNERLVLNYGHTFGHAIESVSDYKIPHGIAVSLGMDIANYISMEMGLITSELYFKMNELLSKIYNGVVFEYGEVKFINALLNDKKNTSKKEISCVLTKGFGEMFLTSVELIVLVPILRKYDGFN